VIYLLVTARDFIVATMAVDDAKICDLMKEAKPGFFSFEYFPPKTPEGVENLKKRIVRMKNLGPVFVDFTWGAGGSTSDLSLELTACAKNELGCVANMHLTCTNQTASLAEEALAKCKAVGVRNICALRGDPPRGSDKWEATEGGFSCALDLVKKMREWHGDYHSISVAAYPEGHPDAIDEIPEGFESLTESEKRRCRRVVGEDGKEKVFVCRDAKFTQELDYLKLKIDAGSDFIITQMFLDPEVYCDFVKACRAHGINVPIIPGIMCLTTFGGLCRMTDLCKTRVPAGMLDAAKACSATDDEFKQWGIKMGADLCKKVLEGGAPGLHFYTLNLEKVSVGILLEMGMITQEQADSCKAGDADAKTMVSAQGITTGATEKK
jgi:methylenetetrahydrofolate reductase (NADPH)